MVSAKVVTSLLKRLFVFFKESVFLVADSLSEEHMTACVTACMTACVTACVNVTLPKQNVHVYIFVRELHNISIIHFQ